MAELSALNAFVSDAELSSSASKLLSHIAEGGPNLIDRDALAVKAKLLLRSLYAYAVGSDPGRASQAEHRLPFQESLFVDGFDIEQIWSQFERFDYFSSQRYKKIRKALDGDFELISDEVDTQIESLLQTEVDSHSEKNELTGNKKELSDEVVEDTMVAEEPDSVDESQHDDALEDEFLRLNEMGDFLDEAEQEGHQKMEQEDILGIRQSESDEEADDVFAANASEEGENQMENQIMYEDFFCPRYQKARAESDLAFGVENSQRAPDKATESEIRAIQTVKKTKLMEERAAIQQSIQVLEDEAVAEKEWPFRGEVVASDRPLNSALEVDLDYDTTVKPPPKPTQADMDAIEDMIRRRIADRSFDDVERMVPPPIEETKRVIELDDTKAKKGLGELYEDAYMKNTLGSGTLEEKEEKLRMEARKLFKEACATLDALTHFHFAPRPVVEDMSVKVKQPAVQMEESLSASLTLNSVKAPQETYRPVSKTGEIVDDKELTREDRKQMRAKRKRAAKASQKAKTVAEGTKILGRKSLIRHSVETGKKKTKVLKDRKLTDKSKPGSSVFHKIQMHQEDRLKVNRKQKASVHNAAQMKL